MSEYRSGAKRALEPRLCVEGGVVCETFGVFGTAVFGGTLTVETLEQLCRGTAVAPITMEKFSVFRFGFDDVKLRSSH